MNCSDQTTYKPAIALTEILIFPDDYVPLLESSSQLSFTGNSISERVAVHIEADNITEPRESFEMVILDVEVTDESGVKQVLTEEDRSRIIFGQRHTRIYIGNNGEV